MRTTSHNIYAFIFPLVASFLFVNSYGWGADVTLRWDGSFTPDLAGYKAYYKIGSYEYPFNGTGSDQGPSPINIALEDLSDPDNPEYTISGLDDNEIYFFALTAYDNEQPFNESGVAAVTGTLRITSPQTAFYVNAHDYHARAIEGKSSSQVGVEIYANAILIAVTTTDANGEWSAVVNFFPLSEGPINLTVFSNGSLSYPVMGTIDITAPQTINEPSAIAIKDSSAVIEWNSNEEGHGFVDYGLNTNYNLRKIDDNYTKNHRIIISDLVADSIYHFRVGSTDRADNGPDASDTDNNPSADYTFATLPATPVTFAENPIIYYEYKLIDVIFDEPNLLNPDQESNYSFNPQLTFDSPGIIVDYGDSSNLTGVHYYLVMSTIPHYEIFTLTVSNITDYGGDLVFPDTIAINDNDSDSMADDWEWHYGLNPQVDDSMEDPDEDGITNLQEYLNRTNPHNNIPSDMDKDDDIDGTDLYLFIKAFAAGEHPVPLEVFAQNYGF